MIVSALELNIFQLQNGKKVFCPRKRNYCVLSKCACAKLKIFLSEEKFLKWSLAFKKRKDFPFLMTMLKKISRVKLERAEFNMFVHASFNPSNFSCTKNELMFRQCYINNALLSNSTWVAC